MTSKVCPVCKTFSSSSNTTLNAHIDQCLSVESNPKWNVDSKFNRHRVKPRKTRLMVDIYARAPKGTLEDLDRRNGTNWATSLHLSPEGTDIPNERKIQRMNPIQPEDTEGDVGAVYVDANGIKVRILSKFNDLPSVGTIAIGEDIVPRKPSKCGKGNKFLSTKRNKCLPKHQRQKYVKLGSQSEKLQSHKVHNSQTCKDRHPENDSYEKVCNDNVVTEQISPRNFLTRGKWVCSKRTGLVKNVKNKYGHQSLGCKLHVPRDLLFDSHHPLFSGSGMDRRHSYVDRNPCPENSRRKESQFSEAEGSDKGVPSTGKVKLRNPLLADRINGKVNRSSIIPTRGSDSGKNFTSVSDSLAMKPSNSTGHHASSRRKNVTEVHASIVKTSDIHSITATKPPRSAFSRKSAKFSESRKSRVIVSQSSVAESRSIGIKQCSGFKKSQDHFMEEVDFEIHATDLMDNYFENQSRKGKITQELSDARNHIQGVQSVFSYSGFENVDCSRVADKFTQEINSPALANENAPEFQEFDNQSKISSSSMQSLEYQKGPFCNAEAARCPTKLNFMGVPENCCIGDADKSAHMGMGLDSEVGKGEVLSEVDPISIPGPPGSFLPSPRDMGSEEYQGNSSLTSSRLQSSHDHYDRDSSATSTFSNMGAARLDMHFLESFISEMHHGIEEESKSGFSGTRIQPSTDNSGFFPQTAGVGAETITSHGENLEVSSLGFRTDDHPCCCQRKDRISHGVLNDYDSQLLKRRTMSSVKLPCMVKEFGDSVKGIPDYLDAKPSMFPPVNFPSSESEKVIPPVLMSHAGPISLPRSDGVLKFTSGGNGDSASPSTSNPVLRLMGKNLMVVNKDEDASVTVGNGEPGPPTCKLTSEFPTVSGVYPGFMQNKEYHTFHDMVSQDSTSFGKNSHNTGCPCVNVSLSNHISQQNYRTETIPLHVIEAIYPDQQIVSNFTVSMESQGRNFLARQNIPTNILHGAPQYYPEKATATTHDVQPNITDYVSNSRKEVIIIDDIPETEGDSVSGAGKSNFRPFPYYWSPDSRVLGRSPMMHNANFITIPSRQTIAHPVRRSFT